MLLSNPGRKLNASEKPRTWTTTQEIISEQYFTIGSLGILQDKLKKHNRLYDEKTQSCLDKWVRLTTEEATILFQSNIVKHLRKGRNRIVQEG